MAFSAQPPDLHRLSLGRESFAAVGPLALLDSASYPIPVRRLADSLPASFSGPLTVATLRFAWVATTNSPGDSHPLVIAHAGHTNKGPVSRPLGSDQRRCPYPFGLNAHSKRNIVYSAGLSSIPSCCIIASSSMTSHSSAILPSIRRKTVKALTVSAFPVGGMPSS